MTIIIPSWLAVFGWVAIGFVLGCIVTKWWSEVWAFHNREPKPVWIPWRQIPCDQCFKDGETYGRTHNGRLPGVDF